MPVHDCGGYTGFFIRWDDGEFHRIALTHRSMRRFRKVIHAALMSTARKNRSARRMAEKQRRKALKEARP